MLRILAIIAPATAASTSASSKTTNGALPPSSIETRWRWSADWRTRILPTSVEPVKLTLRSRSSPISAETTVGRVAGRHHVDDARRDPDLAQQVGQLEHGERGLLGGLDDHRAAGGQRRADLAAAHRQREVPRRHEQARTHGTLERQQPALAVRGAHEAAVDAHRLLGEPAEELRAVGHLAGRLGQRLAHLQADGAGELVGALDDQLVRRSQQLPALARRRGRPPGLRRDGGVEGVGRVHLAGVGDPREDGAVGGVLHLEPAAVVGLSPLSVDEQNSG